MEWKKLRVLGEGSYGIVSQAMITAPEKNKGEIIAVKSSKRPSKVECIKREGEILASFDDCKEILECIGSEWSIGQDGQIVAYHLFTEFAPFGSLDDLIKKGTLSEDEVRVYVRMILRGLAHIHQSGVVHCDLKPSNILLFPSCEDGIHYQLKIADFGTAKTKREVFDGKIIGTLHSMSPEYLMGQIEKASDIWSLGCTIIKMITGSSAWCNVTKPELKYKLEVLKEAPPIPCELSLECKDFLDKCFIIDPEQRWSANRLLNHPFLVAATDIGESLLPSSLS